MMSREKRPLSPANKRPVRRQHTAVLHLKDWYFCQDAVLIPTGPGHMQRERNTVIMQVP